ncbi:hypothetical protein MTO96_022423 [Rhipicephalus appendiculatus]
MQQLAICPFLKKNKSPTEKQDALEVRQELQEQEQEGIDGRRCVLQASSGRCLRATGIGSGVLFLDPGTFHLAFAPRLPLAPTSTASSPRSSMTSGTVAATSSPRARPTSPCPLLERAMKRYRKRWLFVDCVSRHSSEADIASARAKAKLRWDRSKRHHEFVWETLLEALIVNLTGPCDDKPHENMDESYHLVLSHSRPSVLSSPSVWGLMRGLESFSQLVSRYNTTHKYRVVQTVPQCPHYKINRQRKKREYAEMEKLFKKAQTRCARNTLDGAAESCVLDPGDFLGGWRQIMETRRT